jgi:hypothetical protein
VQRIIPLPKHNSNPLAMAKETIKITHQKGNPRPLLKAKLPTRTALLLAKMMRQNN